MKMLYRGFDVRFEVQLIENVFRNSPRPPRDTNTHNHNNADEWFQEQFGIRARSTTLICSTSIEQAKHYGICLMQIEPLPPYRLIFSRNVVDFLNHALEMRSPDKQSHSYDRPVDDDPEFFIKYLLHLLLAHDWRRRISPQDAARYLYQMRFTGKLIKYKSKIDHYVMRTGLDEFYGEPPHVGSSYY